MLAEPFDENAGRPGRSLDGRTLTSPSGRLPPVLGEIGRRRARWDGAVLGCSESHHRRFRDERVIDSDALRRPPPRSATSGSGREPSMFGRDPTLVSKALIPVPPGGAWSLPTYVTKPRCWEGEVSDE